MFKFSQAIIKNSKNNLGLFSIIRLNNYTSTPTELKTVQAIETENDLPIPMKNKFVTGGIKSSRSNNIVAAAFASLSIENITSDIKTPFTDNRIENAENINDLLSISDGTGVSRRHALKVVSILADWSSKGRVKLIDFESDPRFIKLCKILTKGTYNGKPQSRTASRSEDLSTIMSVTADDEAAKLVGSITLSQMVKVMQTLGAKKRRSTMLLRSLAFNITRSTEKLDLKQCADLLYSICILNFPDENLLERIGNDIILGIDDSLRKSAVVGSIITSLGLLRYKDTVGVLDALCLWTVKNQDVCRPQDLFALFLTLAVLNYEPTNAEKLYQILIPQLTTSDANKNAVWLDLIWSLILLNKASAEHISSVLSEKFVAEIESDTSSSISSKLKLLNVNGAASYLIPSYSGPTISKTSNLKHLPLTRTKEKEEMVLSVLETLKNLMQSEVYMRFNINTGMGFYIDAECVLDKKCNPVPLDKYTKSGDFIKIAIMTQDYNDMCRGRVEPTGLNLLTNRLLEFQDYKILNIPYYEYKARDKLVHRVQYLESKLKTLVQS